VFEIEQSDDDANGFRWRAEIGAAAYFEGELEAISVDAFGENNQRMIRIEPLIKVSLKEVQLA
jgi:hypothetical protein